VAKTEPQWFLGFRRVFGVPEGVRTVAENREPRTGFGVPGGFWGSGGFARGENRPRTGFGGSGRVWAFRRVSPVGEKNSSTRRIGFGGVVSGAKAPRVEVPVTVK